MGKAGFSVKAVFKDFKLNNFDEEAERMVVLGVKVRVQNSTQTTTKCVSTQNVEI
jgi:hypothetical protein